MIIFGMLLNTTLIKFNRSNLRSINVGRLNVWAPLPRFRTKPIWKKGCQGI